ncbi:DUF2889 domain-containing protein [Pseudoroseomonas globiformis]|uniref:DUF2889 domain-containing protein n=1 Tax=Teichococcus globiformis TaxID=2307229 RepID=A0ABV7FUA2_9PROT
MPLSASAPRRPVHRRVIEMQGYQREDGLFDIEGHLRDTKSEAIDTLDRHLEPGDVLHGMWIRLTVDAELLIHHCEAASDQTPYSICPAAAANFGRLAGLRIGAGFNRAVHERVGGVVGCTHLREMLAQLATVAFQTTYDSRREKREAEAAAAATENRPVPRPALLNTCLAYAEDSPVVARRWPYLEPATDRG